MAYRPDGNPEFVYDNDNNIVGLWIKLHILGKTQIGFGSVETDTRKTHGDLIKELIGDAIRNAAMRFGVGIDLWIKESGDSTKKSAEPIRQSTPAPRYQDKPKPPKKVQNDDDDYPPGYEPFIDEDPVPIGDVINKLNLGIKDLKESKSESIPEDPQVRASQLKALAHIVDI
ncbi:MAG: hypothetical protein QXL94_06125, partial [Candidatus Parvarchaeum sp.]